MATEAKLTLDPQPVAEASTADRSLLDVIAEDGRIGQTPEERNNGKLWLGDLLREVMTGQMTVSNDTEAMINGRNWPVGLILLGRYHRCAQAIQPYRGR